MKFIHRTLLAATLLAACTMPARAQVSANKTIPMFTNAIVFTNMAVSNIFELSTPIPLTPGEDVTIMALFAPDNSDVITTNQAITFAVSPDGTNYGLSQRSLLCLNFTPLASTASYPWTNFTDEIKGNSMYIRGAYFTNNNNATAMVSRLTNVYVIRKQ